jgi:predicted ArsR family transcriptional regulator
MTDRNPRNAAPSGRTARTAVRRGQDNAEQRRRLILHQLEKPRTQAELRDRLGMSNSGILHLLRRFERDGLIRPAERVGWTKVWEKSKVQR